MYRGTPVTAACVLMGNRTRARSGDMEYKVFISQDLQDPIYMTLAKGVDEE